MALADLLPDYNSLYRVQAPAGNAFLGDNSKPANAGAFDLSASIKKLKKPDAPAAPAAAAGPAAGAADSGPTDAEVFGAGTDAEAASLLSDRNLKVDVTGLKPEHVTAAIARLTRPRKTGGVANNSVSTKAFSK